MIPVAASVSTPPARTRLEFAYDYKNRRIAKKVFVEESGTDLQPVVWRLTKDLRFVYDGYQMIAELDATFATGTGVAGITPTRGVVRTYLWGPDVSGTMTGAGGVGGLLAFTFQGDSYYPISDANGNITAIQAPGIDQVIRFDYDPFGNRLTNTGPDVEICPMGFSSKYTDSETGLVDYGMRIYSPPMARFTSRDPIEERGGINLYGFVGNDPVNHWDYLGLTRPCLQSFLSGYIHYNGGKDGKEETFDNVGGWLNREMRAGNPDYQDSCALRVSIALNLAGPEHRVPQIHDVTTKVPDGNYPKDNQIISAVKMLGYLRAKFGASDYHWNGHYSETESIASEARCGNFGVVFCGSTHCGIINPKGEADSTPLNGRDGIFGWKLFNCNSNSK